MKLKYESWYMYLLLFFVMFFSIKVSIHTQSTVLFWISSSLFTCYCIFQIFHFYKILHLDTFINSAYPKSARPPISKFLITIILIYVSMIISIYLLRIEFIIKMFS